MKRDIVLFLFFLLIFATSCSSDKQSGSDLPSFDVRKNYPEKEVKFTDIADITYLYLNSDDDDYLYKGRIHCITKNTVVVVDNISGSILFFLRDGIPKSRFNHQGQGPENYNVARQVIYDEMADDVFVLSDQNNVFQVYSSTGTYKRKITLPKGTFVDRYFSFDEQSLIIYDSSMEMKKNIPADETISPKQYYDSHFVLISKADGKMLDKVELHGNNIVLRDDHVFLELGGVIGRTSRMVKCKDGVLLCNPETDTVFLYNQTGSLIPLIHKTPLISSIDPMIYLNNCVDAGRYQFMEVFIVRYEEGASPFPVKYYMRDKKNGEIYRQKILLPDYKGKEFVISPLKSGVDYENGPYFELDRKSTRLNSSH